MCQLTVFEEMSISVEFSGLQKMIIAIAAEHLVTSDLVIRMSTAECHSDNPRNIPQSFTLQ